MRRVGHEEGGALRGWGMGCVSVCCNYVVLLDLLSDTTMATRCVQMVITALGRHKGTPAVQTWGAYALYQIICCCALNGTHTQ